MNEEGTIDPKKKINVFILVDYFEPGYKFGGPVKSLLNTFELLKDYVKFYVITRNRDFNDPTFYDVPTGEWIERSLYSIMYLKDSDIKVVRILELDAEIHPECIYLASFFSWKISIQMVWRLRRLHEKIVIGVRGELTPGALKIKPFKKRIFLAFSRWLNIYKNLRFHASSTIEAKDIKDHLNYKQILIAPDPVTFKAGLRKNGHLKISGQLRLCFISRIVAIKNLLFCIETIASVRKNESIFLDIYGIIEDSSYFQTCIEAIENWGLESQIRYLGPLEPSKVQYVFAKYDFFFFPSKGENFGHVIYESLSAGTPVILADTTFWSTISNKPPWGYIFSLENRQAVISLLMFCRDMDNEHYHALSSEAIRTAQKTASSQELITANLNLFIR
ncbi:MAG: glycosyltransferase [Sphingobacteriales bacterium]|nr:MAG: glycosyltransferase [Sphingobacteriales bacterium]